MNLVMNLTASVSLYQGDCLDILPTLAGIDAVVTDPPYGVGKAAWDSEFPTEWIAEAWKIAPRMLVMPGNSAMIQAGNIIGNYRDCIAMYSKNGMTRSKIAFGNWFPVLACGDWKWEARPNVLSFSISTKEKINHPSPKPLAAMKLLIEKYTKPGWTIVDPFMGSGTTGIACVLAGRNFIGIELDPNYFAIAQKRIADAQAQLTLDMVTA